MTDPSQNKRGVVNTEEMEPLRSAHPLSGVGPTTGLQNKMKNIPIFIFSRHEMSWTKCTSNYCGTWTCLGSTFTACICQHVMSLNHSVREKWPTYSHVAMCTLGSCTRAVVSTRTQLMSRRWCFTTRCVNAVYLGDYVHVITVHVTTMNLVAVHCSSVLDK
jgi:hypothetical protein